MHTEGKGSEGWAETKQGNSEGQVEAKKRQLSHRYQGLECASVSRTLAWKTQRLGFDVQDHIDQIGREKVARLFPAYLATV